MKVLLSIKPEYAEKILNGKKMYEFRKSIFKRGNINTVVIYATKPVGKVIGEFQIDEVLEGKPRHIWERTKNESGITWSFFSTYFMGRNIAYAIKVKKVVTYKEPMDLIDVAPTNYPPQSYLYLTKTT